ncbi:hypothetical protein LX36DRAFT_251500 [Colletotrichum falcatum]|nr:hypothetical protein LX36DRAFT_251500 [Colletotrichum falcatum]
MEQPIQPAAQRSLDITSEDGTSQAGCSVLAVLHPVTRLSDGNFKIRNEDHGLAPEEEKAFNKDIKSSLPISEETHEEYMATKLRDIIRAWLQPGNEKSKLVRRYNLPNLVTELQSIPMSNIWLESKEKVVNGNFKSKVELFKGKVEGWTGAPWDWWPLGPTKRRLGDKEDRVYWTCVCGDERWAEIPVDFATHLSSAMNNFPPSSQPSQSSGNTSSAGSSFQQPETSHSSTQSSFVKLSPGQSSAHVSSAASAVNTPTQPLSSEYWVLLIVRSGFEYGLAQIDVKSLCCQKFFQDLRSNYFELRGTIRMWFSVWRYSHCDFYMASLLTTTTAPSCEKFDDSEFVPKKRDTFPGPSEADYEFMPRKMEDRMPPVTPHEFYRRFYACNRVRPMLHFYHRCRRPGGWHSRDVLNLFPKKRTKLEEGGEDRRVFWGIYAREAIALRWVLCYNLACTLPMLVLFFQWLSWKGPDEIQNASVPISVMLAMLSLFWSMFFSSLPFGRSQ